MPMNLGLGLGLSRRAVASGGGGNVAPVITGVPTISGTTGLGDVLTASPASVSGTPSPTRTWQWYRDGVAISGATGSTHTIVSADQGTDITVQQIETNVAGSDDATSLATSIPAAFTPADLFAASEGGFWGQVQTSDLWQDTARTTPVATAGDPVGSWRLNTASGVIYAQQGTSNRRPTYQTDSNGTPYLNFDGTDDCLVISSLNMTASDELTVISPHRKVVDKSPAGTMMEFSPDGFVNNGGFTIRAPWAGSYQLTARGTTNVNLPINTFTAPVSGVLTMLVDISAPSLVGRMNGTQINSSTSSMGTGNFGSYNLAIGRRNDTDLPFQGWIYGLIVRGALTSGTDLTDAEAWADAFINP